jgi:hypothetical protein
MSYADDLEKTVPADHIRQIMLEASDYFTDADKRERAADDRNKRIADAHARGWEQVARAITDGFRLVAQAIENNSRR